VRPPDSVEVLVVGAGPAGSEFARRLAVAGREVLLVEKRPEIGNPVRCAEAVERDPLVRVCGEPPLACVASPIHGAVGHAPDGRRVVYETAEVVGLTLNRRLFDRWLAGRAAAAGVAVLTRTRLVGLERPDDDWRVVLRRDGEQHELRSRLVVAADGVEGSTLRRAGIGQPWASKRMHSGVQARVVGLPRRELPLIELHLGRERFPGGYGWCFPLGRDRANIGLCLEPPLGTDEDLRGRLEAFLAHSYPGARPVEFVAGTIPALDKPRRIVADGLLAVGDAAGHAEPFSGGGIANALQGAEVAAEVAVTALNGGNVDEDSLRPYVENWNAGVGRSLRRYARLRRFYLSLKERDFNDALELLERQLERWRTGKRSSVLSLLTSVVTSSPRLLLKARHLL
jgi:digeranylgeranylglycerophospholipid reductase